MSNQKTRIPKDIRISEIIAWAEQLGCAVEIRLVEKEPKKKPTTSQCSHKYVTTIGSRTTCDACGEPVDL